MASAPIQLAMNKILSGTRVLISWLASPNSVSAFPQMVSASTQHVPATLSLWCSVGVLYVYPPRTAAEGTAVDVAPKDLFSQRAGAATSAVRAVSGRAWSQWHYIHKESNWLNLQCNLHASAEDMYTTRRAQIVL